MGERTAVVWRGKTQVCVLKHQPPTEGNFFDEYGYTEAVRC